MLNKAAKAAQWAKLIIRHKKLSQICVKNLCELWKYAKISVVCLLSSRFPPYLFYWIQIRWIWRQREVIQLLTDICVLIMLLGPDQSNGFLMPRGIVKYDAVSFAVMAWFRLNKFTQGLNYCFIVEPTRLSNDQFSRLGDNKAAVGDFFPTGFWHDFWLGTFLRPCSCYRSLLLKVDLVLEHRDNAWIPVDFGQFF